MFLNTSILNDYDLKHVAKYGIGANDHDDLIKEMAEALLELQDVAETIASCHTHTKKVIEYTHGMVNNCDHDHDELVAEKIDDNCQKVMEKIRHTLVIDTDDADDTIYQIVEDALIDVAHIVENNVKEYIDSQEIV